MLYKVNFVTNYNIEFAFNARPVGEFGAMLYNNVLGGPIEIGDELFEATPVCNKPRKQIGNRFLSAGSGSF